jgi:hypothetical protein
MMARSPRSVIALRNLCADRSPLSHRLRSTETVSTSTRSGAARSRSDRNTARAAAPSAPSSPRALATIEASATITHYFRSSVRSATAWSNPTVPPERRSIRSSTSSRVGRSASRVSSPARYCCSDWPWLSARRCNWACTAAGRSLTSTFGMLALCYQCMGRSRPTPAPSEATCPCALPSQRQNPLEAFDDPSNEVPIPALGRMLVSARDLEKGVQSVLREKLERIGVVGSNDGEASAVECCDSRYPEAFCGRYD